MTDEKDGDSHAFGQQYSNKEHPAAVFAFAAMNQFRISGKLCDVRILTDTSEFSAHKVVLAAFSPYFEAMFGGRFEEAQQTTVTVTDIDASTMSLILEYFYTGGIGFTENNIQAILHASNFLQVLPLFDSCCAFLIENLNPGNCLGIYGLGKLLSSHKLTDKGKEYAVVHFELVCQDIEFLELEVNTLVDIIGCESLNVQSEESVFEAVMKWVYFKEEERIPLLPEVLSHVRLGLLSPEFLQNRVEVENAIVKSPPCMQQVREIRRLLHIGSEENHTIERQRNTTLNVEAFLVFGEYHQPHYFRRGHYWKLFTMSINGVMLKELKPPKYFEYFYVSQRQNFLMTRHRDSMWRYDSHSNEWQPIAAMINRRFSFGLGEVDGFWYAIGGFIPGSNYHTRVFNYVERYQPLSDVWVQVAPIPEAVMSPEVVGLSGMIYVLGGENKMGNLVNLIQRFDPQTNTWTQMPTFRVVGSGLKACALYPRIYLFFNEDKPSVQVFNISSNSWEECAQSSHRFASSPVIFDGKIYVISERPNGVHTMERYSPASDSWEDMAFFLSFRPQSIFVPPRFSLPRVVSLRDEECIMNLIQTS